MARERFENIASSVQTGVSKVRDKDTRMKFAYKAALAATVGGGFFVAGMIEGSKTSAQVNKGTTEAFQAETNTITEIQPQSIEVPQSFMFMEALDKVEEYFDPAVTYWIDDIARWSILHNVDPLDVATIMQIESCGDPDAVSPAGALGLFQVMPFHFEADENPLDPDTNAKKGLEFFAYLRDKYQDLAMAYVGYNAGEEGLKAALVNGKLDKSLLLDETVTMWEMSGMRVQANNGDGRSIIDSYRATGRLGGCIQIREKLGVTQ